jgi:ubiquitin carboxyl-terminal hydrolase 4/11/15
VFEGYGQHDSQECINTVLDFIHEDLYRKEKKPYVEQTESEGKTDQEASIESWNKHVYRNESIILDLFHGQFKSTICCNQCDRISITFDPYLMVQVPIPSIRYEQISAYYIQYDMNKEEYTNHKLVFKMRDEDTLDDCRTYIEKVYGFNRSGFLISLVSDMLMS